jgi:sugar phosphate isomerase/epimerase
MTVHACSVAYNDSFSDAEIDATFQQVKALGATVISSPLTMAMANRLVPFAERHQIAVAIHNQVDANTAGAIATPQLKDALGLSSLFRLKLDIGNLTASNCDPVGELRTYEARVSHVLVKDRLRNGGASQPFGEGDTPIAGVLDVLKASTREIAAFVEYDYVGLHSMTDEIAASIDFVTRRA